MNLLGLAYTVPSVAVLAINRDACRVYLYEPGALNSLKLFLQQEDRRTSVVLVRTLNELRSILQSGLDVGTVILFETFKVMSLIEGIYILDSKDGERVFVRPGDLHISIQGDSRPVSIDKAWHVARNLENEINFRDLVRVVTTVKDFDKIVCQYLVGLINKKAWVDLARKPALAAGVTIEALAELERYVDTSKGADLLWRSFHMFTAQNLPLATIVDVHSVDKYDFEYICEILAVEQGQKLDFAAPPPVDSKKAKRKKAKSKTT